jgi:hypothetical protein
MTSFARSAIIALAFTVTSACSGNDAGPFLAAPSTLARIAPGTMGAGPIISTQDGGQIYGYDVNWNGTDGILASAKQLNERSFKVSVETFDTKTAKITRSFAVHAGSRVTYLVDGIFDNDVALVTRFNVPKEKFFAYRHYQVVNPVTSATFSGSWTPATKDLSVLEHAENQSTPTSVVYALELQSSDAPDLVVSNIAKNSTHIIHLDPSLFSDNNFPQLAQDTVHNRAVMAVSPGNGHAGTVPDIETVDLKSGKTSGFQGADCPGSEACGEANGIAYDSGTGVACTTTQIDAGVEFYDIAKQSGFREQLPIGTGNIAEYYSGGYVASDPINKLCLVAQPNSAAGSGSSIQVYDENGTFVESINGLNFTFGFSLAVPVTIAINPSTRTGWVNGPAVNQLQEFSY